MKITSPFYIEKRSGENHIDLCGKWEFTYVTEETDITKVEYKHTATLPAATYWNVYEAGILPHPYKAANSRLYRDLDQNVWYYRRTFNVARSIDAETENAFLCFDGIGYYSKVWLNGILLGSHEGMFGGPVCDVADKLKQGENEIVVELKAHDYGWDEDKRLYGSKGTWHAESSAVIPWNIARDGDTSNGDFTTFGIWREIRIEIMPKKHIARPYLYTKSIDGNNAVLGLELNIATEKIRELEVLMGSWADDKNSYDYTFAYRAGLSGILSGEKVGIRVKISDETKTVFDSKEDFELYDYDKSGFTLEGKDMQIYRRDIGLSDIELWYPNGLGNAKLYDVEIEMYFGGMKLDTLSFKTGIRTIEQSESAGRKYRQRWDNYHFSVNGRKIFLKGMNWMPTDFLYDEGYEDTLWTLEQVKNAGIQLLRVWSGGGKPESDLFYDLCDKMGIMVWQDAFPANHNCPEWNSETFENEMCYYLYRIRNHASLAVHCGGNEQRAYHKDMNAVQYIVQRNAEDLDFSRKYYRVSPDRGSMHTYNDMEPVWFRKRYGDLPFMAECGIHCFPNAKSLRQLINEKEYNAPLDKIMDESFRADFPELLNHFTEYRADRVPRMLARASHISNIKGITLEKLCEATGMAAYEFYQFLCQSLREAYPHCVGLMPWVFKRAWTTTAIQMVDGLGEPVAPYYAVKNSYSDVMCFAALREVDYAPGETVNIPVRIINDSAKKVCGTVRVDLFSPCFEKTKLAEKDVCINADSYLSDVVTVGYEIPSDFRDKFFFIRTALWNKDGLVSQSFYPIACLSMFEDKDFAEGFRAEQKPNLIFENGPFMKTQIANGEKGEISVEILKNEKNGDRLNTTLKLICRNAPVYPVNIQVKEDNTVSFLSDNFFFMDKDEERVEVITTRFKDGASGKCTLTVKAWNIDDVSIDIS